MRILPHHQDTGGFFIAVLEKSCHLPGSIQAKLAARALEKGERDKKTLLSINLNDVNVIGILVIDSLTVSSQLFEVFYSVVSIFFSIIVSCYHVVYNFH